MAMHMFLNKTAPPIYVLLAGSLFAAVASGISVWPLPSHYSSGDKVLWIAESVQFTYKTIGNAVFLPSLSGPRGSRC